GPGLRVPGEWRLDVGARDGAAVLAPEQVLEQHLQGERQPRGALTERVEAVDDELTSVDRERAASFEAVRRLRHARKIYAGRRSFPSRREGCARRLRLRGERLKRACPLSVGHVVAVAGVLAVDHGQGACPLPEQLAAFLPDTRAPHRLPLRLESGGLAARKLLDLLRDAHAAPVVAAHRAEVGVDLQVLVVQRAGRLAVEGELELPGPVERGAGPREIVVPVAGPRDATRDVARVGSDLVGDAAGLDVLGARQPDVLLG